jgi:hypothetical protein
LILLLHQHNKVQQLEKKNSFAETKILADTTAKTKQQSEEEEEEEDGSAATPILLLLFSSASDCF